MAGFVEWSLITLSVLMTPAHTFVETPKFSQLRLLYPGYPQNGGHYSHEKLLEFVLGLDDVSAASSNSYSELLKHVEHSTAAVRLSWTLNRYGGRYAIGRDPVYLSSIGRDSFTGRDGQQYIFRNAAFGPFLAARYGNPLVSWGIARPPTGMGSSQAVRQDKKAPLTAAFRGRQGIVRVVSYRRQHEDGHVALWDCTRFHESRDWTNETHVISVEFWESADSFCAPEESANSRPSPHLEPIADPASRQLVPRDSLSSSRYLHEQVDDVDRTLASQRRHGAQHKDRSKIWIQ